MISNKPVPPRRPTHLKRNIRFYRIFNRLEDNGAIDSIAPTFIPELLATLNQRGERYLDLGDGVGIECETIPQRFDCIRMIKVTWDDHPEKYTLAAGPHDLVLAENEGLREPTHVRFFANNIVAAEVTRRGPSPTTLREFLHTRFPDQFHTLRMVRIADNQALERLARIVVFESAHVRLSEKSLHTLPPVERDFWEPLTRFGNFGGAPGVFEFGWKLFRKNGELNAAAIRGLVLYLIENNGELDSAAQIQIKGRDENGAAATFNLQRGYVAIDKTVAKDANGRIDSASAFIVLGKAFNDVLDRLPPQEFIV